MRTLHLVDNSVIQRIHRCQSVFRAWSRLSATGELATCLPTLLELGYSARSAADHATLISAQLAAAVLLAPVQPATAIDLQTRLFRAGKGRAVGAADLQIAATALDHSSADTRVIVVHYDSDFDHLASVRPDLRCQWIVPQGSVD
ncbi:MAG: PIN domain-containing protein [Actinomycetia bacterium]|nr:PIN domain-containing protein [Actinomycetes bacterium]